MTPRLPEITRQILYAYDYEFSFFVCLFLFFWVESLFQQILKGILYSRKFKSLWLGDCTVPRDNPFLKCLITVSRPGHQLYPLPLLHSLFFPTTGPRFW